MKRINIDREWKIFLESSKSTFEINQPKEGKR